MNEVKLKYYVFMFATQTAVLDLALQGFPRSGFIKTRIPIGDGNYLRFAVAMVAINYFFIKTRIPIGDGNSFFLRK